MYGGNWVCWYGVKVAITSEIRIAPESPYTESKRTIERTMTSNNKGISISFNSSRKKS